jgi:epoxyqueuosine reductase
MKSITEDIRIKAKELGFSKIGITKAEELTEAGKHLGDWLTNGYHGEMEWMSNSSSKRVDPRQIFPKAKTILVGAFNYYSNIQFSGGNYFGKISRHALGADYHSVIKNRLQLLYEYIREKKPETDGKIYVDSGAVMEKVWSQKAGVGWTGKNTISITREFGSWCFIGVIVLNLDLDIDRPHQNFCGTCNKCIEACPTQALVSPYVLDARRCIAYLNIEYEGNIQDRVENKLGSWIYGCDVCQDVCPWNRKFARETTVPEFTPDRKILNLNLSEYKRITSEDFEKLFIKSTIKRIKYKKFVNNIKAVLDNIQKGNENDR